MGILFPENSIFWNCLTPEKGLEFHGGLERHGGVELHWDLERLGGLELQGDLERCGGFLSEEIGCVDEN